MTLQVRPSSGTDVYPHMPIRSTFTRRANLIGIPCSHQLEHSSSFTRWPIGPILGFGGAKFPKMVDSLPGMPMNRRAKFDAASFMLGWEIRNRTNKQTHKQ